MPQPAISTLNFEHDLLGTDLSAGQVIDTEFSSQITISSDSPSNPVIVFDTANPTGDDTDLTTPMPPAVIEALGKVLVIAENTVDANGDGLVDDPNDKSGGGSIFFDFVGPVQNPSITILDNDAGELLSVSAFDESGTLLAAVDAEPLGNNSVQTLNLDADQVSKLAVTSNGSFAVDDLTFSPASGTLEIVDFEFYFQDPYAEDPKYRILTERPLAFGEDTTNFIDTPVLLPELDGVFNQKLTLTAQGGDVEDGTFELTIDHPFVDVEAVTVKGDSPVSLNAKVINQTDDGEQQKTTVKLDGVLAAGDEIELKVTSKVTNAITATNLPASEDAITTSPLKVFDFDFELVDDPTTDEDFGNTVFDGRIYASERFFDTEAGSSAYEFFGMPDYLINATVGDSAHPLNASVLTASGTLKEGPGSNNPGELHTLYLLNLAGDVDPSVKKLKEKLEAKNLNLTQLNAERLKRVGKRGDFQMKFNRETDSTKKQEFKRRLENQKNYIKAIDQLLLDIQTNGAPKDSTGSDPMVLEDFLLTWEPIPGADITEFVNADDGIDGFELWEELVGQGVYLRSFANTVDKDGTPSVFATSKFTQVAINGNIQGTENSGGEQLLILDFETDIQGNALLPGQRIDDEFERFVKISACECDDPAIIFDSANPTGGDTDLGTPNQAFDGPGVGAAGAISGPHTNDSAQNNVLIIAENTVDSNGDGLVDVPDDNVSGGSINFDFEVPVTVLSLKVLDQASDEAVTVNVYDADDRLIESVDSFSAGPNSVQILQVGAANVRTMEVITNGSIAIDDVLLSVPPSVQEEVQPGGLTATLGADDLKVEEAFSIVEDSNADSSNRGFIAPESQSADETPQASDIQIALFDVRTNALVHVIQDGDEITVPSGHDLTLAATLPQGSVYYADNVESIRLSLNDGEVIQTENMSPYALFGDKHGDFNAGSGIPSGSNQVTLELFDQDGGNGQRVDTVGVNFTLVCECL